MADKFMLVIYCAGFVLQFIWTIFWAALQVIFSWVLVAVMWTGFWVACALFGISVLAVLKLVS